MKNVLDNKKDHLGTVMRNVNRTIIVFELIGVAILGWLIYTFAVGN